MIIGNKKFDVNNHTYIMGILNVTPDSFSDGGNYNHIDKALFRVEEMVKEGVDILDIGGESTRPGYEKISDEEEINRVIPAVEKIKERFEIPISLDTYKSKVAFAGIKAGADMINDIWGLMYDKDMAEVIASSGVACCLMHNKNEAIYENFFSEVTEDFKKILNRAKEAGIQEEKIVLDPGVGFGKTYENNLEIIRRIGELKRLGYPILLGASRKSVIGLTLNLPVEERLNGSLAISGYATAMGCSFLRVHDIKQNKEAVKMVEAIINA